MATCTCPATSAIHTHFHARYCAMSEDITVRRRELTWLLLDIVNGRPGAAKYAVELADDCGIDLAAEAERP